MMPNKTTLLKAIVIWLSILLVGCLLFLFGMYSQAKEGRVVQAIKELHSVFFDLQDTQRMLEEQARNQAEAKAVHASLIQKEYGFQRRNEQILNAVGSDNILRYLYTDIDFIADFNSSYCPKRKLNFLLRFSDHAFTCVRIEYQATEQKTYALIIHSKVKPEKSVRDLLVYNHGHDGVPSKAEKFAEKIFVETLRSGNDVMLVSMPYKGLDEINYKISVKTWDGWAEFNPTDLDKSHAVFELFDTGKSHFIRYFVDNAVISVMHFRYQYNHIDYLGLSGGATTGLYTCALLKEIISNCVLVAGVMPAKFRLNRKNIGDAEQFSSSLLKDHKVIELIREISVSSSRLSLSYNSADACCFDNPSADAFKKYLASERIENVNFLIRESDVHGFDPTIMLELLRHHEN